MKKLIPFLALLLFLPLVSHANIAVPWLATSTAPGYIQPNPVNGNNPFLKILSTATSTFQNGINLTTGCFSVGGVCVSGSGSTLITAGTGISTSTSSGGAVLVSNTGVTSLVAGTNITLSGSTGAVTVNSSGGGTNYLTNAGLNTYLNTGTYLEAPALVATSTATSTLANQDGVLTVTAFPGAELGVQETEDYTALPSFGGTIKIPAGFFNQSTQFNASTTNKYVSIICDPAGTYITWTGAATSTIINPGQGTGSAGQSISNCHYIGTATSTGQVAIQLGGSNGAKNFSLNGVEITNFGLAVGTEANTYLETFNNDFVHGNGKDFSYQSSTNAGENIRFNGGTWADCTLASGNAASDCIDFSTFGASDVTFNMVSMDDAQVHLGNGTRAVTFLGGHIENPWADTEPAYTPIVIDNSAVTNVTVNGTIFTNGANTQRPAQDILNGGTLTVVSATTEDYGGGTKGIANFVTNTGNGWTKVESINKQDSAYTNLYNSTGGTGTLQYNQEDNGYLGLGVVNPTSILSISASSSPQLTSLLGIASSTGAALLNVYGGGFVTIGTTSPRFALEVVGANNTVGGSGLNLLALVNPWSGGSGGGAGSFFQTGIIPIAQGDRLGFQAFGYTTGNANTNAALIGAYADQAWTVGTNQGTYIDFETTPDNSTSRSEVGRFAANSDFGIGTTTPAQRLSVQGNALLSGNLQVAAITATSTLTLSALTGTQCLQEISGVVSGTGSACSGATFAYPFTNPTNFGTTTFATTTPFWAKEGVFASSTSQIASTTFSINGNVGIGSTSPWGSLSVQPTVGGGVPSVPSFVVGSSTAGTSDLVVDQNGNVIFGANSPTVINGSILASPDFISNDGRDSAVEFRNNTSGSAEYAYLRASSDYSQFRIVTTDGSWIVGNVGDASLRVWDDTGSGVTDILINKGIIGQTLTLFDSANNTGYVGIGSSTPYANLSVMDGGTYLSQAAGTAFAIGSSTQGLATSTLFTVSSAGLTSMLTATTTYGLQVGIGNSNNIELELSDPNNWLRRFASDGSTEISGVGGIRLDVSGATDAILASNGSFGIGTTTPVPVFTSEAASTTAGTIQTAYVGVVAMITGLENTTLKIFFEIDQWGDEITSGDNPSVSGGTSSVSGNQTNGKITVVGTALTSVTLTFAHPWPAAPDCVESDNQTASVGDIGSISTTQIVFNFSVGVSSASVWYQCVAHQ